MQMKSISRMVRAVNRGAGLSGFVIVVMCLKEWLGACMTTATEVGFHTEQLIWNQNDKKHGMKHPFLIIVYPVVAFSKLWYAV